MNRKGVGPIGAVMLFGVFLILWFVFLASWVNTVGQDAVSANNLTGIEAFFFSNLNFFIMVCMLLGMMGWMYFASDG